jgi:hypothetical protein
MARFDGMNAPEPADPPAMPGYLRSYIAGRIARDMEQALVSGEDVSDHKSDVWEALSTAMDGPMGFMQQYVMDRMEADIEQSAAIAEFKEHTPSEDDIRQVLREFEDTEARVGLMLQHLQMQVEVLLLARNATLVEDDE